LRELIVLGSLFIVNSYFPTGVSVSKSAFASSFAKAMEDEGAAAADKKDVLLNKANMRVLVDPTSPCGLRRAGRKGISYYGIKSKGI